MAKNIVRFELAKSRDVEDKPAVRGGVDGKDSIWRFVINFSLFYALRGFGSRREVNRKQIAQERLPSDQALCDKLKGFAV